MAVIAFTGLALPSITNCLSNSYTPHFYYSGFARHCIFHGENLNKNRSRKFISKKGNGRPLHAIQAIKLVETYDASFQLEPEAEKTLKSLLSSEVFCNQVALQAGKGVGSAFEFTGEMFKPVPWSVTTKHGMPQEFEKYLDCDKYAIVNVPPNFMFKSKSNLRTDNKQVSMVNRDYRCWIEPLDQVSKTTNINALGIRNCIAEAIACEPPEWARALLLPALGKDFSNAKEIISSVRACYYGKEGSHINGTEKKERQRKNTKVPGNVLNRKDIDNHKTTISSPESVTECCRNAFREIVMEDKFGELFSLVYGNSKGLLDFNLINVRMKAGTYGKSPELFAKDMQKVWDNIRSLGDNIIELSNTLQDYSGAAYQRQVFSSAGEEGQERDLICASKKIKQQSANKDSRLQHPLSMNQHHASKHNNQLQRIPSSEKLNSPINMKTNKQNGGLTKGMEAENVLQIEDGACKNLDINQHLSNKQSYHPSSELDLSLNKQVCKYCGNNERHNFIILCDACETAYHTNCISPPLEKAPCGGWCCASCVASGKGNKSLQKDLEKQGYHCIVCERLSRELEPQDSRRVLKFPVNEEQYRDINEKGLPCNKEEMEINQGEGAVGAETEVNISTQQEKYPIVDDSTKGLRALNASFVVNSSSTIGTGKNSQDHETKIPQYQSYNGTHIARYCLASPERGVSSDDNCGSKDNFRIFFRRKNKSRSGEDTDSTETGKSKRKCLEP